MAFLLFAAALFVVGPAEASRTTTGTRSHLAASSSRELASLELTTLALAEPIESSPRFGFAEDLGLLDVEARPCGFELFGGVGTKRCALTYARNNPLKYVDPDGRDPKEVFQRVRGFLRDLFSTGAAPVQRADSERSQTLREAGLSGTQVDQLSNRGARINAEIGDAAGIAAGTAVVVGVVLGQQKAIQIGFEATGAALGFAEGKLASHFVKHGAEFGVKSEAQYLAAARGFAMEAASGGSGIASKIRAGSGDTVLYKAATNEFAVVAKNGTIRTYFKPNDGISYFLRQ